MIISRERYFDDTSLHHVSLILQTRTREMHSVLSDAPEEVRQRVGEILVEALNQIQALVGPVLRRPSSATGAADFGCGT